MSIRKKGSFRIKESLAKFKRQQKALPRIIANQSLNFFRKNFRDGGFTDDTFQKWEPRFKRISRRRISRTEREPSHLTMSGKLKRSLTVKRANFNQIILGTRGVRYARRHNEGITDRRGRPMPKRKYMGNSRKLNQINIRRIKKAVDQVFK